MINKRCKTLLFISLLILLAIVILRYRDVLPFLSIPIVFAHCDTMDGPVIKEAGAALEQGDVTPVLKWVKKEHETEIKTAFNKALAERAKSQQAKEDADMEFFETLVRIHREGEGAPYTGLKPAGTELEPAVAEADKSLETGSIDRLIELVTEEVASGIRKRFSKTIEKKKHKDESVEAGREFVEAYVEFVHYVERLYLDAEGQSGHHEESKDSGGHQHHH